MEQRLILGPPGTGKTTTLLNIVEEHLERGLQPNEIAFMSFTRKAAYEARDRAIDRFGFDAKDFRWFSTLHSAAYRQIGLSRNEVMQFEDWKQVASAARVSMTGYYDVDVAGGLPGGKLQGDQFYFYYCLAHAKGVDPLNLVRRQMAEDRWGVNFLRFKTWLEALNTYREDTGLFDYTSMLDAAVPYGALPNVKVAIIDEAQDLSYKQWQLVEALFANVEKIYYAGDDDQAIYKWSGADLNKFQTLPGEKRTLDITHRLPPSIYRYSLKLVERIKSRYHKDWYPADKHKIGRCYKTADWSRACIPRIEDGGDWLLLVRNGYQIQDIVDVLRSKGILYSVRGKSQIKEHLLDAIMGWERLRQGKSISKAQAQSVYACLRGIRDVKKGFKDLSHVDEAYVDYAYLKQNCGLLVEQETIWHEALNGVEASERNFLVRARKRGEKLLAAPRVNVSTIHSVKGGEAENVVLFNGITKRTLKGLESQPDDEHRVFYVGATRAKKDLFLVETDSMYCYDFPPHRHQEAH